MVKSLTCPICGKRYNNTTDLINCIKKDEKLNKKVEEQQKVKQEKEAKAKEEIMNTYKMFKERIDQFNKEFAPDHFDLNISYRGTQVTSGYTPSIEKSSDLESKLKSKLNIGDAKKKYEPSIDKDVWDWFEGDIDSNWYKDFIKVLFE